MALQFMKRHQANRGFGKLQRVGRKIVGANRTARTIAECVFSRLSRRREFALAPVGNASRFFYALGFDEALLILHNNLRSQAV
jgi:hypothetical protein